MHNLCLWADPIRLDRSDTGWKGSRKVVRSMVAKEFRAEFRSERWWGQYNNNYKALCPEGHGDVVAALS